MAVGVCCEALFVIICNVTEYCSEHRAPRWQMLRSDAAGMGARTNDTKRGLALRHAIARFQKNFILKTARWRLWGNTPQRRTQGLPLNIADLPHMQGRHGTQKRVGGQGGMQGRHDAQKKAGEQGRRASPPQKRAKTAPPPICAIHLRRPFAPCICAGKRWSGRVLLFANVYSQRQLALKACAGAGAGCRKKSAPLKIRGRTLCRAVKGMLSALGDQGRVHIVKNAVEKRLLAGTKTIGPVPGHSYFRRFALAFLRSSSSSWARRLSKGTQPQFMRSMGSQPFLRASR